MALQSFLKTFSDKIAYFSNWKFNFQKTRVIGSLRHLDEAMEQCAAAEFLPQMNRGEYFYSERSQGSKGRHPHSLFYEEALFLNHVVKHWSFDESKLSKYELEDYRLAVKKLEKWENLINLITEISHLVREIKQVTSIRRIGHSVEQLYMNEYPEIENELMAKYKQLLQELEPFPEWKAKVVNEVERLLNILASQVLSEDVEDNPFKELDPQKYFK